MRTRRLGLILAVGVLGSTVALAAGEKVTVRATRAKVLAEPDFLADPVAEVKRGQVLERRATDKKKYWYQVQVGGKSGWLQRAAVVEREVRLSEKPGSDGAGVARDEVELAGRGFTPEIEAKHKAAQGPRFEAALKELDAIQQVTANPTDVRAFAQEVKP